MLITVKDIVAVSVILILLVTTFYSFSRAVYYKEKFKKFSGKNMTELLEEKKALENDLSALKEKNKRLRRRIDRLEVNRTPRSMR